MSVNPFAPIGPGGFEPPLTDPKSAVLPLDEGPVFVSRVRSAGTRQRNLLVALGLPPATRPAQIHGAKPRPMTEASHPWSPVPVCLFFITYPSPPPATPRV